MKIRLATLTCLLIAKGAVAQTLVNPSFEVPDVYLAGAGVAVAGAYQQGSGTPVMAGWRTTNTGGLFEVWTNLQSYAPGIQAYDGNQWIELNADQVAEVYQDLSGVASGTKVGFNFAHRGRAGVDVMEMQVVDLGTDGVYGTGDDTVLFDQTYSDDKTAWGVYQNPQPITSLGHVLRMRFISISSSNGDSTNGNFLDAIQFGVGIGSGPTCDLTSALTLSQGGWHTKQLTQTFFNGNFSSGLKIGGSHNSDTLTQYSSVQAILPASGTPAALSGGASTNKSVKNTLAGQAIAATLNLALSNGLSAAYIQSGPYAGFTVSDLLSAANNALDGAAATKLQLSDLTNALDSFNASFANGHNSGYISCTNPLQ